jgi:hypothetical protein
LSIIMASSSSSNSCPLGNAMCLGCGQCGKVSTKNSSNSNSSTLFGQSNPTQTTGNSDYLTATAVNAYEMNSIIL